MTSVPLIRPAEEREAHALAGLLTKLGHPTTTSDVVSRWQGWSEAGNHALVAVAPDGALSGLITLHKMIVLHRPLPVGRITALVVDESVRGQGVGRALVAAAEAELAQAGCGLLEVTSSMRFLDAHTFYEHLGYDQTSVRFAKELDDSPVRPR